MFQLFNLESIFAILYFLSEYSHFCHYDNWEDLTKSSLVCLFWIVRFLLVFCDLAFFTNIWVGWHGGPDNTALVVLVEVDGHEESNPTFPGRNIQWRGCILPFSWSSWHFKEKNPNLIPLRYFLLGWAGCKTSSWSWPHSCVSVSPQSMKRELLLKIKVR